MHAEQLDNSADFMTEAEYLAFVETSEIKYEYRRGKVYAMTGGSVHHAMIAANIIMSLGTQLAQRNCTVTSSDLHVQVKSEGVYRYPDVTVFCGEPEYAEERTDTIRNPVVLVEVLSPGTVVTDFNDKLREFTAIPSLQAYLLVAQNDARIDRFMRHEGDEWLYTIYSGLEAEIHLPSIDCTVKLSDVYNKVTFESAEDEQDEPPD